MAPIRKTLPAPTARPVAPALTWDDLVLAPATREALDQLRSTLTRRRKRRSRLPGILILFLGPGGNGQTLAASLLGQDLNRPLYQADLSRIVSPYLGETEKNLSVLLDKAEDLDALLLLDEGDALFDQRTDVAHLSDRYANLETSYLLQRLERFAGIVILTSNRPPKPDSAFQRRMHAIVEFPLPDAAQRLQLWRNALGEKGRGNPRLDLLALARAHELTASQIATAARLAVQAATQPRDRKLSLAILLDALRLVERKPA